MCLRWLSRCREGKNSSTCRRTVCSMFYTAPHHKLNQEMVFPVNHSVLRPKGYLYLAIEAGVSESMPRLQADAAWWFANLNGARSSKKRKAAGPPPPCDDDDTSTTTSQSSGASTPKTPKGKAPAGAPKPSVTDAAGASRVASSALLSGLITRYP